MSSSQVLEKAPLAPLAQVAPEQQLACGRAALVAEGCPAMQAPTAPSAARMSRRGAIKVHVMSPANLALALFFAAVAAVTVFTLATMDFGKAQPLEAAQSAVADFWTMMVTPALAGHFSAADVAEGLLISLALALLTTTLGAVLAFLLGLFAASNLSSKRVSNAIKVLMSIARAVPTILWVLVFSVAIGLGAEAAVTGLLFHSVAYLVKAYSEAFEEVDQGVIEALRSTGAGWWQVVGRGVVPEKVNELLSWTFIRFEINFVNAVAVGAVAGAGGIGYQLFLAGSFYLNIHEVGLIVYLCLAVAVALELLATKLRKHFIVSH
ncbi:MAG: PhnE/PtxC family ABC transporter permease [Coriobacteriales bacterium]